MYKVINLENFKKRKQYNWFRTFSNPCYGINVKMDITEVVKYTKETKTSFFINILYLITIGLNSVEEMRLREVNGEIRLYDTINPTFTVMTKSGVYENTGFEMIDDYKTFYATAKQVIDHIKNQDFIKETFNDSLLYNDYYMTCLPWLSINGMTHPLCDNNYESLSCPRVCWDKYVEVDNKYLMTLNITVNHCFVDGYPLSLAFKNIQENFNNCRNLFK
ncbi:MAG: hypothetical protein J6K18_01490 [Bacilli bacterium]|nr:hypothetical protein [Bacilli bacterium]